MDFRPCSRGPRDRASTQSFINIPISDNLKCFLKLLVDGGYFPRTERVFNEVVPVVTLSFDLHTDY